MTFLRSRFLDLRPQLANSQYGPEPSLFDIIERYYIAQHVAWDQKKTANPQAMADAYINAWLTLEHADRASQLADINRALSAITQADEVARIEQFEELQSILRQLDELAIRWGDESGFHQCRDRLRKIIEYPV